METPSKLTTPTASTKPALANWSVPGTGSISEGAARLSEQLRAENLAGRGVDHTCCRFASDDYGVPG